MFHFVRVAAVTLLQNGNKAAIAVSLNYVKAGGCL